MRVALLGNMNNNFFAIARWLRFNHIEAHVFYNSINFQFEPKADTFKIDNLDFCHKVDWWISYNPLNINVKEVKEKLSGFDVIIGQGNEAAYAWAAGIKSQIYYPYGSDFYKYAQPPYHFSLKARISAALPWISKSRISYKAMKMGTFGVWQKGVITDADYVFLDKTNPEYESKLLSLGLKGKFEHIGMPFLFHPEYETAFNANPSPPVHFADEINTLRKQNKVLVLFHGRQEWKNPPNPFSNKGVDRLIRGFAAFIKEQNISDALLIMLDYGNNVVDSKNLISELGIEQHVKWFPTLYRKDLMYLVKQADLCTGEFEHSFLTFGTIMEAHSMRKPILHYLNLQNYHEAEMPNGIYPLLNAREPQEISNKLKWAYEHPVELMKMGEESFNWYNQYFIQRNILRLLEVIKAYQ